MLTFLAPAKLNLHLRVVGRRRDGYHLLDSLMVPISLFDRVACSPTPNGSIRLRCSNPRLEGEDNLGWRAATLLRQVTGCRKGADIRIRKRIPIGAGLGGGSTDAAAVLLLLNDLWRLRLPPSQLARIGLELGADVPFFLAGGPARVRGIGDRIDPTPALALPPMVVSWPGFVMSTKWVYGNLHWAAAPRAPSPIAAFLRGRTAASTVLQNDLQAVAEGARPKIARLRRLLERLGAAGACMTGSGSAVFGIFPSERGSRRAAAELRRRNIWAVAVRGLESSPRIRR